MKVKLLRKVDEAPNTKSFYFEKPENFQFSPGQYIYLTLPLLKYPDPRGATRHFTLSISPTEAKDTLRITCRIREESGFKKTLDSLQKGTIVEIEGPTGTFILDKKTVKPQVFLAGGIGITPFRSFIKYNLDKNLKIPMYLLYSNKDDNFAFGSELKKWDKEKNFINVSFINTSKSGHLDSSKIKNQLTSWRLPSESLVTWWVVGPPPFVTAMEEALAALSISPLYIRTEKFTGY